jgi:GNAT superfamily N-acetyltransferase
VIPKVCFWESKYIKLHAFWLFWNELNTFIMLELIPIKQTLAENQELAGKPDCLEILTMTIDHYKVIGFVPPWIGYFAQNNGEIVGSAGYKGQPLDNKIEIAYWTSPNYRNQGIGTEICGQMVLLARQADAGVIITARTLPEGIASNRILEKNGFKLLGTIWDKDDGEVLEWQWEEMPRV